MIAAAFVALVAAIVPFAQGNDDWRDFTSHANDENYLVDGIGGANAPATANPASSTSTATGPPKQYIQAPLCVSTTTRSDQSPACPNGDPIEELCLDGSQAQLPWWFRTQGADGYWSEWQIYRDYTCPTDAPLLAAIQREWTQLHPQPSDIALQPNTGWVIATVPTVAMAGDATRLHQATLLGAAVDIRATASGYRWDWGDGSHTQTSDPGRPYPHATLTHTYPHASAAATVALTTTWTGQFRINGGAWMPFDSTITSASTPVNLVVYDPRSRLVDCDLQQHCRVEAHG